MSDPISSSATESGDDGSTASKVRDGVADVASKACSSVPDCSSCGDSLPDCSSCGDLPDCGGCLDCGGCDCSLGLLGLAPLLRLATPSTLRARRSASAPGRAGIAAIRGYQRWISPRLPIRCRYTPSCSEYGAVAVRRFGLLTGSRLIALRISRCSHGVRHGTADPVPT